MNEWDFSFRRLNFQLLDVVGKYGGCVVVDSTRRGKSMPDALSKTVPIWCCVMNRALFPEREEQPLYTPPQAVSASEHAQMERRIDRFVGRFLEICRPDVEKLKSKIGKPMRPIWVTQASHLPEEKPTFEEFHPVVLCTASRRVHGAEVSEGGYVQGAADDHEAWAHELTPSIFWTHKDELLRTNEEDLPPLIAELVKAEKGPDAVPILVQPTENLYVSTTQNLDLNPFDVVISCTPEPLTTTNPEHVKSKKYLHLQCQGGKLGSRDLRSQLPHLRRFFATLPSLPGKILICCPTGKDLSVGVALAILCLYSDDKGSISPGEARKGKIDKTFIKQRLTWLTTTDAKLNPSRGTLQSVNAFLMPDPSSFAKKADPTTSSPVSSLVLLNPDGTRATPHDKAISSSTPQPSKSPHNTPSLFHALHNTNKPWTFIRTLTSALPTHPSGTVTGTATFTPYDNNNIRTDSDATATALLYSETGEFHTTTGVRFTARRSYVYTLNSPPTEGGGDESSGAAPCIAVHFHEAGPEDKIGGLFVDMSDLRRTTSASTQGRNGEGEVYEAHNKAQHICGEDFYAAKWRFSGAMINGMGDEIGSVAVSEEWWEVEYEVKGPKKDYVSTTRYTLEMDR